MRSEEEENRHQKKIRIDGKRSQNNSVLTRLYSFLESCKLPAGVFLATHPHVTIRFDIVGDDAPRASLEQNKASPRQ
jgi:hypothetical protein